MQEKGTRGGGLQLGLATIVFTICFMVWGSIATLAPALKDLYHLSASQVVLLVAVPTLLGSVAPFPLGILADRFGGRLVFSVLVVILLAPVGLMALTNSYASVLAVAFFIGLGAHPSRSVSPSSLDGSRPPGRVPRLASMGSVMLGPRSVPCSSHWWQLAMGCLPPSWSSCQWWPWVPLSSSSWHGMLRASSRPTCRSGSA